MRKLLTYVTPLLIAVAWLGCQENPSSPEIQDSSFQNLALTFHLSSPAAFSETPVSQDVIQDTVMARARMESLERFHSIVNNAEDWEDAHLTFEKERAEPSQVPDYVREQIAAAFMLRSYLFDSKSDLNSEQLDAVGIYTEMLIKHRSPDGPLLTEALQKLGGHWTKAKITESAQRAIEGVEMFLTKRNYNSSKSDDLRTPKSIFMDQEVYALEILREMSGQG